MSVSALSTSTGVAMCITRTSSLACLILYAIDINMLPTEVGVRRRYMLWMLVLASILNKAVGGRLTYDFSFPLICWEIRIV